MVVVVITAVVGVVVNAGEVVGAGILADVTDVTARNDRAQALQVPILWGIEASREWAPVLPRRARVGERFADTTGPTLKASKRTHPFQNACRARVRDFASHCLLPLHSHLTPRTLPHSQRYHFLRHQTARDSAAAMSN
jgi:hypothetical protein